MEMKSVHLVSWSGRVGRSSEAYPSEVSCNLIRSMSSQIIFPELFDVLKELDIRR